MGKYLNSTCPLCGMAGELGLEIWQREMITPLQTRLVWVLLAGVQQDRMGATTDAPTSTIRGVIHSFVDVNMYKKKSTLQVRFSILFLPAAEWALGSPR